MDKRNSTRNRAWLPENAIQTEMIEVVDARKERNMASGDPEQDEFTCRETLNALIGCQVRVKKSFVYQGYLYPKGTTGWVWIGRAATAHDRNRQDRRAFDDTPYASFITIIWHRAIELSPAHCDDPNVRHIRHGQALSNLSRPLFERFIDLVTH